MNSQTVLHNITVIYELLTKYDLLQEDFKSEFEKLNDFKVVTPIVGKFSTGKSSLLNALIGKSPLDKFYLGVDLTPETSVPAEITFAPQNKFLLIYQNGNSVTVSLEDYVTKNFDANKISKACIFLDNEFLKSVGTVQIVDMPGFDSGIELHNRAIDDYLSQSRAYILTFAATEPFIPESIDVFLRELKLYEMPVYIVITKSRSVTDTQLKQCVENIQNQAAVYLGLNNVSIVCTNAKGRHIDVEPFAKILRQIESDSKKNFVEYVNKLIRAEGVRLTNYLRGVIRQTDLTPSEIEARKEESRLKLEKLKHTLAKTRQEFSAQVAGCLNAIQNRVSEALYSSASSFESALLNNSDISGRINSLIRETVITAVQREFDPKFKRYVEKMNTCINVDINTDFDFKLDEKNFMINAALQNVITAAVKKVVPKILKAIGLTVSGPLVTLIGIAASLFFDAQREESRRNEQRLQIRRQLHNQIIPDIISQVDAAVRKDIYSQVSEVNRQIDETARQQIQAQEKIFAELTKNFEVESKSKNEKLTAMTNDLNIVTEILQAEV